MSKITHPHLGFGLGLRPKHYPYIFEKNPAIDWFEIISENFMDTDGKPRRNLARIKEHYSIVMHGVSMSIGTASPLNSEYLHKLKALIKWVQPAWISDHLCWTGVAHKNTHDLLPIPYTEEALKHIVQRIKEVQDFLETPIALENPSTYLEFKQSSMPEAEFIARMAEDSKCNLLLDVNNVYVSCYNHRLDAKSYIDALPLDHVIQIHLSGHSNKGSHIIDTHDSSVIDEVWNLYKYVVHKAGRTPNTMIEWDDHIPEFPQLEAELNKAKGAAKLAQNYIIPELYSEQLPQIINHETSLAQSQMLMQDAIMLGENFDSAPENWIRFKEDFKPQAQLNVYLNAYRYRLYDVVAEDYPVLKEYLGKDVFDNLIWQFINQVPPTHFNIGRFALKLPEFLQDILPKDNFAHELVELETCIAQLADYEETEPLQQKHLEGLTPDKFMESELYPRKALKLMTFNYPVNNYYSKVMNEESAKKPRRKLNFLAIFRHDDVMWRMDLEHEEYNLLTQLFSGEKIGDALNNIDESAAEQIFEYFSRWIRNGILAAHECNHNQQKGTNHETT
jgi:uncharacterized protein (UPF0276 family)